MIRRIRMCYWKQWRRPRTKVRNLVRLGVNLDMAIKHAISRKSYCRLSRTPAMRYAMPNKWLEQLGLVSLKQLWCYLAPLRGTACQVVWGGPSAMAALTRFIR